MPPLISPTFRFDVADARHRRHPFGEGAAKGVQRRKDRRCARQRIDPGLGPRGMGGASAHRHLKMKAAIMGDGDAIGEAGADGVVRLADGLRQQPAGADQAAGLLVIGEMKLDRTSQRRLCRAQRQQGEGIGREIGFGNGGASPIHPPVSNLGAVGVAAPTLARCHDIAMRIQGDHRPTFRFRAKTMADDQVGGRDHPRIPHQRLRHRVTLDGEAQRLQQLRRERGMRGAVPWRIIGGIAHERRQKVDLLLETGEDGRADPIIKTHGISPWVRTSRA